MRHQHRLLPPRVLLYRGQAEQADQQHDQQYAARTAEDHAEEAVGAGEAGDPDQFADEVVDQRPEQQGRDEQQRAGCDDAGRGVWMYSPRCCASAPPNIQATAPATIQVSRDKASLTKPRLRLIRLETTMMATIVQSTQVNATMQPTSRKGAAF